MQFAKDVGPRRGELLRKFGIETVEDLLYHLPFRYEDRRRVREIGALQVGEEASIIGELVQLGDRTVGRGRRRILEGVLRDATGLLGADLVQRRDLLPLALSRRPALLVYGKVERSPGGGKRIIHPEVDLAPDEQGSAGMLPVYEKPTTMTVGTIRKIVQQAARELADAGAERAARERHACRSPHGSPARRCGRCICPEPDADVDRAQPLRLAGASRAGVRRAVLPAARNGLAARQSERSRVTRCRRAVR